MYPEQLQAALASLRRERPWAERAEVVTQMGFQEQWALNLR